MSLFDALTGKISKYNNIKEEGAKYLFSIAERHEKNSYFYNHYETLGILYLGFCQLLFQSEKTISYKINIRNVNYEYMLKYMVSIVACELFNQKAIAEMLKRKGFSLESFIEKTANDCDFSVEEKEYILCFAADYNNIDSVRIPSLLGYANHYYSETIKTTASKDEVLAVSGRDIFLINSYFHIHEDLQKRRQEAEQNAK